MNPTNNHYSLILMILILVFSAIIAVIFRKFALKFSILDVPNERSSHSTPVPRGGGIAIVISFYAGLWYTWKSQGLADELFFALLPGLIIALIGFIDDVRGLPPLFRLLIHLGCSGFALFFLGGFHALFGSELGWVWSVIGLLIFVWFINLFNFLDGSDGYASMEAISISLILWFFTQNPLLLILTFSVAGFMFWNWPKAKIFMGDSGSTVLGFIVVVLGTYFHNQRSFPFSYWILITSLFWFDATVTLIRRIFNKENLSHPHKKHIYQRAIRSGLSHLKTLLYGFLINILLFSLCLLTWENIISIFFAVILCLFLLSLSMFYIDSKFKFAEE